MLTCHAQKVLTDLKAWNVELLNLTLWRIEINFLGILLFYYKKCYVFNDIIIYVYLTHPYNIENLET